MLVILTNSREALSTRLVEHPLYLVRAYLVVLDELRFACLPLALSNMPTQVDTINEPQADLADLYDIMKQKENNCNL